MSDPTTEGFQATPAEIEGMVRNLCAYALGEPDPVQRYLGLTHQQVLFEGMVDAIRRERGRVLADLVAAGVPVAEVAESTRLGTVAKVRKLIGAAGETERVQEAAAEQNGEGRSGEQDGRGGPGEWDGSGGQGAEGKRGLLFRRGSKAGKARATAGRPV